MNEVAPKMTSQLTARKIRATKCSTKTTSRMGVTSGAPSRSVGIESRESLREDGRHGRQAQRETRIKRYNGRDVCPIAGMFTVAFHNL